MQTVNHYGKAFVKSLIAPKNEAHLVPGDNQENSVCYMWHIQLTEMNVFLFVNQGG